MRVLAVSALTLSVITISVSAEALRGLALPSPTPLPPLGWGEVGHKIVGCVADNLISSDTKSMVHSILNGDDLEDVAFWADSDGRDEFPWSSGLHYADLPSWACKFDAKEDCPKDYCVYGAVLNFTGQVSTSHTTSYDRTIALKFLTHFLGDMHQPLHVGFKSDLGGNDITVSYEGESSLKLHHVWDDNLVYSLEDELGGFDDLCSDLTKDALKTYSAFASALASAPPSSFPDTVSDWLSGTAKAACDYAYTDENGDHIQSGDKLTTSYYEFVKPTLRTQLMLGAQRLASILDLYLTD